jgi:hypothetical protein
VATQRDDIRANRAKTFTKVRERGVNIDDLRKEVRTPVAMMTAVQALVNDGVQRPTRHQTMFDVPLLGTYDGVNAQFELSMDAASELNVEIGFVKQSTGTFTRLTHTGAGAPSVGSVRIQLPRTIIVGEAPAANDILVGFYVRAR